jgi:hypothetical protein
VFEIRLFERGQAHKYSNRPCADAFGPRLGLSICLVASSSTNDECVTPGRSPILHLARNLLERLSEIGRRCSPH